MDGTSISSSQYDSITLVDGNSETEFKALTVDSEAKGE